MTEATLPPFIHQMLQPGFYPHPVREPVRLLQTHVSYVLLTGDYAYKLKKSVNFGFLDYSTLDKRRHFCEEEVRLNQRGAAAWYLGVVPITETDGQYHLEGAGDPVEYALRMREFPQERLFLHMLERGELGDRHMETLGKVVSDFHATCHTDDYIRAFGEVDRVRQSIDENYAQTEKYVGDPQSQAQLDATKAYSDAFFAQRFECFQERQQQDKIRECHGDLHLRNIFEADGEIVLFDCIEFNEPFRFVDFMYDVAFMVMDLEARDRPDLGNIFLNTYLERSGDWRGAQVLPLYLSRQAYVRAKVSSFLLDDPGIPAADKAAARSAAAHYYHLAWQYTQMRQGKLILMSGLSGAGKSTVARLLAKRLGAIHIRSDAVRKHLGGVPLDEKGDEALYTAEMSQKTYDRLVELGTLLGKDGWTVILDAKYDRIHTRETAIASATANHLPLSIYHCDAPEEVLRDRLSQRQGDIADATADLVSAQMAATEPFTAQELPYVIRIDTTADIEAQLSV